MSPFLRTVAACLIAVPASALAQDVGGAVDLTGMGIYGMEDAVMEAARGGKARAAPKRTAPARLTYTPSSARRKANLARFVAAARAKDPKTAAELERLFAGKDVIAAYGRVVAPLGLRTDNVADAYALWWAIAWNASRGREIAPNRAQLAAVKAQAARALGSVAGRSKLTDATKQGLAEACMVQAMLIDASMEKARGKPERLKAIAASVRQGARASGLDLGAMELTAKGFVVRG